MNAKTPDEIVASVEKILIELEPSVKTLFGYSRAIAECLQPPLPESNAEELVCAMMILSYLRGVSLGTEIGARSEC